MLRTYKARRGDVPAPAAKEIQTGATGPSVGELAAGAQPTREQMGSRVDLPGEIREKMENSFGADFSNVKLYESDTVAEAGAEAVTQGSSIAFAPGKLDLTSTAGQALLGHELSHVVSQARGESTGRGFLNDAHLEAQADRQGMMAARGESVFSGPVSPIGVSSTASAAGPMQAKKPKKETPRTKDGTDVSEFAGNDDLVISEPNFDAEASRNLNDDFAKNIMENMNDISDQALFNPDFMKFVSAKAGENARDDMKNVADDAPNWHKLSASGFRGKSNRNRESGRAFQNLTSAIAFRGLEGGKGEDGKLRTNMTSRFTNNGQQNLAVATQALQSPENEGIVDMLLNYQAHAFDESDAKIGRMDLEQRSAMVMNNVLNSFAAAAFNAGAYNGGDEEGSRMSGLLSTTMRATKDATARQSDKVPGAPSQNAATDAGDAFLGLLTPEVIDLSNDDDDIIDIDDLDSLDIDEPV